MECTKEDTRCSSMCTRNWSRLQRACCLWTGCLRPGSFVWSPARMKKLFGPTSWQYSDITDYNLTQERGSWNLRTHMLSATAKVQGENLSYGSVAATQSLSLAGQHWCRTLKSGEHLQCWHSKSPEGNQNMVCLLCSAAVLTKYSVSVNYMPQTGLWQGWRKPVFVATLEQAKAGALES